MFDQGGDWAASVSINGTDLFVVPLPAIAVAAAADRIGAEGQPPAMAASREALHHADAEKETTPLAPLPAAAVERAVVRARKKEYMESLKRIIERVPPALFPWWRRLPFLGPDRNSIPVGQPLDDEQIEMLRK